MEIEENRMLDAVHCSTSIIRSFIREVRASIYSDQTVIVVMSDHLAHSNPARQYLKKKERKLMFMINLPTGRQDTVTNPGTHYDVGPTILGTIGFDNTTALGFGHNMLLSMREGQSINTRDGLLPEQFALDRIRSIARQPEVKAFVRTKWGNYLGAINKRGIFVDESDLTIRIDEKILSFRHPNPHKVTTAGALLFLLERGTYRIKDITSLNDFIRLPERFSILHWLKGREGIYLYVGSKYGVPFLAMEEKAEENVVAFIDPEKKVGTVIRLHGELAMSLEEIDTQFRMTNLNTGSVYRDQDVSILSTGEKKGISLLSCLNDACQIHIEDAGHDIYKANWGISIFQIADSGDIKRVGHIDHCADRESYSHSPSLDELVKAAEQTNQVAVILIGHNSVFCDPQQDLTQWFEPFSLEKLRHIKFKQPYIGVINLRKKNIEEFVGNEFVQATL
jgi:hypothetical protein